MVICSSVSSLTNTNANSSSWMLSPLFSVLSASSTICWFTKVPHVDWSVNTISLLNRKMLQWNLLIFSSKSLMLFNDERPIRVSPYRNGIHWHSNNCWLYGCTYKNQFMNLFLHISFHFVWFFSLYFLLSISKMSSE